LGVLPIEEALRRAKEMNLDLVEVSAKATPPVVKIIDYGKYLYLIEKKEKKIKKPEGGGLKEIKISLGISEHDLELKAKKTSDFLASGEKIKIEMSLPGRTKYLKKDFIEERLKRILNFITAPYRRVEEPKRTPRGIYLIIEP